MMMTIQNDIGRAYAECILFWMLENAVDGRVVEDFEMQDGSGLPDFEFRVGLEWLIDHHFLDRKNDQTH